MHDMEQLRYSILALQREGNRMLMANLRPLGVTPAQAEVLTVVNDSGPLHLRQLGHLLVCETGSPSRLVASLVDKGLLERMADPEDVRRLRITLTEKGRTTVRKIQEIEAHWYQTILHQLPRSDSWRDIAAIILQGTAAGAALKQRGLWPVTTGDR